MQNGKWPSRRLQMLLKIPLKEGDKSILHLEDLYDQSVYLLTTPLNRWKIFPALHIG
jgi:hypothetical protein